MELTSDAAQVCNEPFDTLARPCYIPSDTCGSTTSPGEADLSPNISIVEAAQMLDMHRDTVRELVRKGELKGFKKTPARTSPFVVDRDSVLEFDRRRRAQFQQPAGPAPAR